MGLFGGGNSKSSTSNTSNTNALSSQGGALLSTAVMGNSNSTAPLQNYGSSILGGINAKNGAVINLTSTDFGAINAGQSLSAKALDLASSISTGAQGALAQVALKNQDQTAPGASSADGLIKLALIGAAVLAVVVVLK